MYLSQLHLNNFRSYSNLNITLTPGVTIFIGENGEGKTNIIESIIYLSILSSHRVASDQPLVLLGKEQAIIRAEVINNERKALLELEINPNRANRARLNSQPTRSQRSLLGFVNTVFYTPEDLDLVRGDPGTRRFYIDQLLIQESPRLSGVISDYERVVRQRNSLLKTRAPQSSLTPWDNHLIDFGAEIIAARTSLLEKLAPFFEIAYKNISHKKTFSVQYRSSLEEFSTNKEKNRDEFTKRLAEIQNKERERGVTLIGPHRDDLLLLLDDHPVKGYASQGESWSVALSLKLASYLFLKNEGIDPILILDDVFSELDEARREQLVDLANTNEQTLITVAVDGDLPQGITGGRVHIKNGALL